MHFLNPILLSAGLACIAVPILIHILMRRRRRPIRWGAMEFLLQAYRQQRQRLRFEQWLLLGARCLLVALLALAIGKPVFSAASGSFTRQARDLYLVVDNSLTAQATDAGSGDVALSRHKASASALLDQLDVAKGDRAGLVLLAGPADPVVVPPSSTLADVHRQLERVQAGDSQVDLPGALRALGASVAQEQQDSGERGREIVLALLSDWRVGSSDVRTPLAAIASLAQARVVVSPPAPGLLENVAIARVRSLRPALVGEATGPDAGLVPVRVELLRSGGGAAVTTVRAEVRTDPAQPATAAMGSTTSSVTWAPGQTAASVTMSVRAPETTASTSRELFVVASIDRDAMLGDNTAATTLAQRPMLVATIVGDPPGERERNAGLDRTRPEVWMSLALDPVSGRDAWGASGGGGGVRVQLGELRDLTQVGEVRTPGAPAGLRESSVLILTRPDLLDAAAWRGVRGFALQGGLVMVTPPADVETHLWPDAMAQGLEFDLTLTREARSLIPDGADAGSGLRLRPATGASEHDLLAMLRGELTELAGTVRVGRALGVANLGSELRPILELEDGSPAMLATRVRETRAEGATSEERGWIVLWLTTPALGWTDLPAKPLMVPLMQELVRQGALLAGGLGASKELLAGEALPTGSGTREWNRRVAWRAPSGTDPALIALRDGEVRPALRDAGVWSARGDQGQSLGTLVVQAQTRASDTTPISKDSLESWIAGLGAASVRVFEGPTSTGDAGGGGGTALADTRPSPPLSLPLLIAAAIVALVEVVLARWFSHAAQEPTRGGATGGAGSVGA